MDIQNKEHEGQAAVSGIATLTTFQGKNLTHGAIT